ncbi:MAG: SDR family NAD(P)-dependent oxidoreductase [Puniceicoccales bacterium]|jgi:short-subunit dehydrogenase|nr:SDR family NAD(P)-dependent oxidoreductase [Puniceicoccales bacterium]
MFPYRQALVTGASGGLGRAFALALVAQGVTVWGTSRDGTRLPEGVRPLALDLDNPRSIVDCIVSIRQQAPELDLLVNNAGNGTFCPFEEFPSDELGGQWRVLLASPVALCRAFYPMFRERGNGAIVNVASLAGDYPIPFMSAYSAAKAGLSAFSRALMIEAEGSGVVVIDFQPGDYATGFNNAMRRFVPEEQDKDARPSRLDRVWRRVEQHLQAGPPPEHAAKILIKTLKRNRSATVVAGNVWQARLGPLLARIAPRFMVRDYLKNYYNL